MIRNESKRLEEWISFHYKHYNIDYFLFYLDNPEDNSEETLLRLKNLYPIDYLYTNPIGDHHVYNGNNFLVSGALERQIQSFTDGFHKLKYEFDWIAIFDVDEWIVPVDIHEFNLKKTLSQTKENILYLPMYNFEPPFDYDKSIVEQNLYRWSNEERNTNGHKTCGKSIIRGKILTDLQFNVDVHMGPYRVREYSTNVDFESKCHTFRLYQWQSHLYHKDKKYEIYDDKIIHMVSMIKSIK